MSEAGYYIVVTPFFPTEDSFRGPFIYDQVQAIRRTGKFRDVIVFRPGKISQHGSSYTYNGVKVHLYGSINPPSFLFNGCTNGINARFFCHAFRKAGLTATAVSIVHAHVSSQGACAVALKQQNPGILTLLQHHDPDPYTIRNGKWAGWCLNARYRAKKNVELFSQIDCHVSVSRFVERHLIEFPYDNPVDYYESYRAQLRLVQGLAPATIKRSIVLHNGVDVSKFAPKKETAPGDSFTIGCIANFVDWKDQMTLLKAVELLYKQNRNIKLRLVGSGPTLAECIRFVQEHGLSDVVSFEQEVQHYELKDFYRSLDLFVLPSYFEGFGCVYLEAAACGVPFMACEGQGIEDYIHPEERHLWLCPPADADKLADMIEHFFLQRPRQELAHSIQIDDLIPQFLTEVQKGECCE